MTFKTQDKREDKMYLIKFRSSSSLAEVYLFHDFLIHDKV
jgi:hypothetical protein